MSWIGLDQRHHRCNDYLAILLRLFEVELEFQLAEKCFRTEKVVNSRYRIIRVVFHLWNRTFCFNTVDAFLLQKMWLKDYRHFGRISYIVTALKLIHLLTKLLFPILLNLHPVHRSTVTSHCLMAAVLAICYQYVFISFFVILVSKLSTNFEKSLWVDRQYIWSFEVTEFWYWKGVLGV